MEKEEHSSEARQTECTLRLKSNWAQQLKTQIFDNNLTDLIVSDKYNFQNILVQGSWFPIIIPHRAVRVEVRKLDKEFLPPLGQCYIFSVSEVCLRKGHTSVSDGICAPSTL